MAAQVLSAIKNGEPQPFDQIAEVGRYFEPTEEYASLFQDGSVLFNNEFVWSPEQVRSHENWPMIADIIETILFARGAACDSADPWY